MIYKAVEVIWIFLAGGRTGGRAEIEGSIRGPRGPKNKGSSKVASSTRFGPNHVATLAAFVAIFSFPKLPSAKPLSNFCLGKFEIYI